MRAPERGDSTHDPTGADLPGVPRSFWMDSTRGTDYPPLSGDVTVDTAVIGGGIVGLTTAAELAEAGQSVAVVEADRIVEGVTGHTTAKVTAQHGLVYDDLVSDHGRTRARQYAAANADAIEYVADRAASLPVDCEFVRAPAYTYAEDRSDRSDVRAEVEAARGLGLPAEFVEDVPIPVESHGAVRFDDQAWFHPRKYLLALADDLTDRGVDVYENTRALDLGTGSPCRVRTDRGRVTAADVVVATNFPVFDRGLYFARLHAKRSYVVACRPEGSLPEGMYYSSGSPFHSVRPHEGDSGPFLFVGGQNHKTGQGGSTRERYRTVARWAREHFDVDEFAYRWSTHDYVSVDGVPVVGRLGPATHSAYVAAGFGGWGMTNGTAAGRMLADEVLDRENPWAGAFDPLRFRLAGAWEFLRENADAAGQFTGDWTTRPRRRDAASLAPDEATVRRAGGDVVASYRDPDGELHEVSAVCTHMRCLVRWNDAERSWDCPCHGSRFDYDGSVIQGPAVEDLDNR